MIGDGGRLPQFNEINGLEGVPVTPIGAFFDQYLQWRTNAIAPGWREGHRRQRSFKIRSVSK